ncbi:hypothetical protein ACOMHN_011520 [Nucella lapillus]
MIFNILRILTLVMTSCLCPEAVTSPLFDIKLGVILPYDGHHPWRLQKVVPAVEYAKQTVARRRWLPGHNLVITTADSQCSETEGPLAAFSMYINNSAYAFLGPACNYAIAPVARYSARWGIPVITAGALVRAFQDKGEYRLLTRILGTYDKSADFFIQIFQEYGWAQVGLLFHNTDIKNSNAGKSECYFNIEGVYEGIKNTYNYRPWFWQFDETISKPSHYRQFLLDTSKNARSK